MINTILPTPKKTELFDGVSVIASAIWTDHPPFAEFLPVFTDAAKRIFDLDFSAAPGGIRVEFDETLAENAYRLDSREGLVLTASAKEGLLYALATAIHAIKVKNGVISCEKAIIEDYPEKPYRALMVDLVREWIPAKRVYRYIDVCFMQKLNYLHLHLVDDQRFTLPSKAFPLLPTPKEHYTEEDIRGFCAYAKLRGITLIPELEIPGHARHLTTCYPEVFGNEMPNGADATIVTEEGVTLNAKNIVCAGKQATMDGIRAILEEICDLFPDSPYIHLGGEEAVIKAWNYCPHCRAYMEKNGIEDEYDLYSDFIARVTNMVFDLGRTPIVWEGFPKKGSHRIRRDTIVIAWESHYQLVTDLLEAGFPIINASWQPLYIVDGFELRWGPKEILEWNVYNWQHWWEHSVAKLNPIHVPPTEQVLGAQICAWQTNYEQNINFVMENCTALSERLWTVKRLWELEQYHHRHHESVRRIARLIQDR